MKIGFAKFNLISDSILNEEKSAVSSRGKTEDEHLEKEWDEYSEKINNEKVFGHFLTNSELKIEEEKSRQSEIEIEYQHKCWEEVKVEAEKINSQEDIIFIRANDYMSIASTRRNMYFFSGDAETEVVQAFPIKRGLLAKINKSQDVEFKEINIPDGWYIYSLDWQKVQMYVAEYNPFNSIWMMGMGISSDEIPELIPYTDKHAAIHEPENMFCWCGCGKWEGVRMGHCITHQVVISAVPLTEIR